MEKQWNDWLAEYLNILQIIGRHVNLGNDHVVLLAEEMLAQLLPDALHGLAVGAPGGEELHKHRDTGIGGHRLEVVSNKYFDRSEAIIFILSILGWFTRSSNLLVVAACLNVVSVILIWKTQWTVLCWYHLGFHSLVEISLNQPQTLWAEMLKILFSFITKTSQLK